MTDAETKIRTLHEAVDRAFGEVLAADRSGRGAEKYCDSLVELLGAMARAARGRKYGRAVFDASIADGVPTPHKGIEAGFLASVK